MSEQPYQGNRLLRLPFKTLTLTFYDSLDYPYTTTYYIREETTYEQIEELVRCMVLLQR